MSYLTLRSEHSGAACIITLARAEKRNAVSTRMMDEIMSAAKEGEADPNVRAIILTGGDSFFSAGADLNEALQVKTPVDGLEYFEHWHRLNSTLEDLGKPVLAAIEGFCITGGLELALACDLRVAGEGSTFAITSSKIGTVAGAGGTQRLPRLVGSANALDMLFSADPIAASEAYRIGLINRLVPKGQALAECEKIVQVYEQRAPLSLKLVKRAVHSGVKMDLASAIEFETSLVTLIYGTQDKQEGVSAFLEKRDPKFQGR